MSKTIEEKKEIFFSKLKDIYPNQFEDIIKEISYAKKKTFRLTCAGSEDLCISSFISEGYEISKGPFKNTYILDNDKYLSDFSLYKEHKIYIQSLSSMLPVFLLDLNPSDKILDICAAPGSKTSLAAEICKNPSNITANENNENRFFALKNNLNDMRFNEVNVIKFNASVLWKIKPSLQNYFDKIICDVPCSNEGVIRLNQSDALKKWNYKSASHIASLQKKIIFSAINLLKPGGSLIYSTCTFSVEENEEVINWALKKFNNIQIENLDMSVFNINNFVKGVQKFKNKDFSPEVKKTCRILPNKIFDGFFIAKLEKSQS